MEHLLSTFFCIFTLVQIFQTSPSLAQEISEISNANMDCDMIVQAVGSSANDTSNDIESNTRLTEGMLMSLGWGVFAMMLAHLFNLVRRLVYEDTVS